MEWAASELAFDDRVRHLAAGYENSQSVARFIDTKAVAVLGVVPVVLGTLAAAFAWLQEAWRWREVADAAGLWLPLAFAVAIVLLAAGLLVLAFLTVAAAFDVLTPRDSGTAPPSVLFPFKVSTGSATTSSAAGENFASRVLRFASGEVSKSDALECYRRQVVRMGEINPEKFRCLTRAVAHLKRVFLVAAVALAVMLAAAAASGAVVAWDYINRGVPTTGTPPAAVQGHGTPP